MTATEYLRQLQEEAHLSLPRVTVDPGLHEQRLKDYGSLPGFREVYDEKHTAESRDDSFHDIVVSPLLDQLPEAISAPLRKICVGYLPSTDLNAWAIRAPNGAP